VSRYNGGIQGEKKKYDPTMDAWEKKKEQAGRELSERNLTQTGEPEGEAY